MRASHLELVRHEAAFPTGHRDGYAGFTREMQALREAFYADFLANNPPKQPTVNEVIAAFGDLPPEDLSRPYDIPAEVLANLGRRIQRKYIVHFKNIRRSWANLIQFMPELMAEGCAPRDVLEMSTAHGATLEILRRKGHRVVGNDYANFLGYGGTADTRHRPANGDSLDGRVDAHGNRAGQDGGWPYQPIIDSLALDVRLFDAGRVPYPLEAQSFDSVICFDAIEHYCHPSDWMVIVDEFARLARRSILLITNPVQGHLVEDADYMAAFYSFQKAMRSYDRAGFECVHAGINRNQLTVYKLVRTGNAPPRRVK
jgi:SAM-dependent methyltransferase